MEGIVTCNICTKQFENFLCIPRILECGHTFCSPCLIKITETCPTCPKCRAAVNGSISSLPINYSNLEAVEIYQAKNRSQKEIKVSIRVVESNCKHRKDLLTLKKSKITASFEVLDDCLEKLKNLTIPDNEEINTENAKKVLNEVIEELKKTDDVVRSYDVKSCVSFFLTSFQSSIEYLSEIYRRVENDQKVFAVHKVNDKIRYGKVVWNVNQLLFHSLSLTQVPKDSTIIWFDELKQCANFTNFYSFIKISIHEKATRVLTIKMFNKEKSHHFVKLCTGEYGPSYKGASFCELIGCEDSSTTSILHVSNFLENDCEVSRKIDYNFADESKEVYRCEAGQVYLSLYNKECSFKIFVANRNMDLTNIFGKVVSPINLIGCIDYSDPEILTIVDSGIILEV